MTTIKTLMLLIGLSILIMTACKKENNDEVELDTKRLTEIVPQAYIDEAIAMGFTLYTGDNPPSLNGDFLVAPLRIDASNKETEGVPSNGGVGAVGYVYENGLTLRITEEQNEDNLSVSFLNFFDGNSDRSKPFVIGSGNNFTICRHRYGTGGSGANFGFPYVYLISGTKDGDVLKNVKIAVIRLKTLSTDPEAEYEQEYVITIQSDVDGASPLQ